MSHQVGGVGILQAEKRLCWHRVEVKALPEDLR